MFCRRSYSPPCSRWVREGDSIGSNRASTWSIPSRRVRVIVPTTVSRWHALLSRRGPAEVPARVPLCDERTKSDYSGSRQRPSKHSASAKQHCALSLRPQILRVSHSSHWPPSQLPVAQSLSSLQLSSREPPTIGKQTPRTQLRPEPLPPQSDWPLQPTKPIRCSAWNVRNRTVGLRGGMWHPCRADRRLRPSAPGVPHYLPGHPTRRASSRDAAYYAVSQRSHCSSH